MRKYKDGDILKTKESYWTVIKLYPSTSNSYLCYECDSNGRPLKPDKYDVINSEDVIKKVNG